VGYRVGNRHGDILITMYNTKTKETT
jgi:hypothetical protein